MKERPILFSGPMVRAILEGRKTQTRRIVKPQPVPHHWEMNKNHALRIMLLDCADGRRHVSFINSIPENPCNDESGRAVCPYGQPGDRLWVRETWSPLDVSPTGAYYRADIKNPKSGGWKPSIHMPRWASRITLEITDIRVERLQEISELDAITEGLTALTKDGGRTIKHGIPDRDGLPGNDDYGWHWSEWEKDSRVAYRKLWESINGQGSWDENPWVWVIEFRRINP